MKLLNKKILLSMAIGAIMLGASVAQASEVFGNLNSGNVQPTGGSEVTGTFGGGSSGSGNTGGSTGGGTIGGTNTGGGGGGSGGSGTITGNVTGGVTGGIVAGVGTTNTGGTNPPVFIASNTGRGAVLGAATNSPNSTDASGGEILAQADPGITSSGDVQVYENQDVSQTAAVGGLDFSSWFWWLLLLLVLVAIYYIYKHYDRDGRRIR